MLSNDLVKRALHTFWQAFGGAFLIAITNIFNIVQHGGLSAGKSALLALGVGVVGAVLSAVKTALVQVN